jgi:hypothetical protein
MPTSDDYVFKKTIESASTGLFRRRPAMIRVDPHPTLKLALRGDMQEMPAKEN